MPAISVIMPAYNCRDTIQKAIASLQQQAMEDFELIVVDDASADDTAATVKQITSLDTRVRLIQLEKNGGVGNARHVAVEHCTGTWITVLDADDWYAPDRLSTLLRYAENHECDVVIDNLKIYDYAVSAIVDITDFGGKTTPVLLDSAMLFDQDNPLCRYPIGYCKPMVKRSFLQETGITYNSSYRVSEDFLFLAEILLNGGRAFLIPYAGYIYLHRLSPTSRVKAPTSQADSGFDNVLVKLCNDITAQYAHKMTLHEKHALERKKRITLDWLYYMTFTDAVRRKAGGDIIAAMLRRPAIIGFGIANMLKKMNDKSALRKFQLSGRK